MTIEIGSPGPFQVGEETADPGGQMRFEHFAIGTGRRLEAVARKARHDLAQDGGVIFRLSLTGRSFDSELAEIRTQAGERSLVQESGQVIGFVRQQFSASEADEEIEILALDALARGAARRLRTRGMRQAERTCIAAQRGETLQQCAVGRACEQH